MSASLKTFEAATPAPGVPRVLLGFERIVAVIDPALPHQAALDKAARIAARTGAKLELCVHEPAPGVDDSVFLREFGGHVIRTAPDLVIKPVSQAPDAGPAASQIDWMLMRQLPVPLLLVTPDPWPDELRIAVSVDPCHPAVRTPTLDEAMLATSCMLAEALPAELDVLHVLETPPHLPGEPTSRSHKLARQAGARAIVESFIASAAGAVQRVRTEFAEGPVAERIVEFVRVHQPQLLTMGFAARPRWVCADTDGITGQVLQALPCDLLITKPPGFVSPLLVTDD